MKNVLIPSDFSVQSLNYINSLLQQSTSERLAILLVHAFAMPDSISELLLLPRRNEERDYASNEFRKRCHQLEQAHPEQIHSIRFTCFHGNTAPVFKNFLDGNCIDVIAYPKQYVFKKLCKTSFDLSRMVATCGRKVILLTDDTGKQAPNHFPRIKDMAYSWSLN